MTRFILRALLLCSLVSTAAFADSVTIFLSPNNGSGDNFGFQLLGAGYSILGGGGLPYANFNDGPPGYAPGSTVDISGPLFFDFGMATIGASSDEVDFMVGSLSASPITLPTDGLDFTGLFGISFDASGTFFMTGKPISVSGDAQGFITFEYLNGGYYPEGLTFTGVGRVSPAIVTPEPSTWTLIGSGLLWVMARVRKKGLRELARAAYFS
jgi:hypothetical protein